AVRATETTNIGEPPFPAQPTRSAGRAAARLRAWRCVRCVRRPETSSGESRSNCPSRRATPITMTVQLLWPRSCRLSTSKATTESLVTKSIVVPGSASKTMESPSRAYRSGSTTGRAPEVPAMRPTAAPPSSRRHSARSRTSNPSLSISMPESSAFEAGGEQRRRSPRRRTPGPGGPPGAGPRSLAIRDVRLCRSHCPSADHDNDAPGRAHQERARTQRSHAMKRRSLDIMFSVGGLFLAGLLLVMGIVLTSNANFAKNYTHDQLLAQGITFKTADTLTAEEKAQPCLVKYAGQALATGKQAECYANHFIGLHVESIAAGRTYATQGDYINGLKAQLTTAQKATPQDPAKIADLNKQIADATTARTTLFQGET